MALRNILKNGDPALRKKSRVVTNFDRRLHVLLEDMRETLKAENGLGLAAPQVGVLRRVVIIDAGDRILELINPEIIDKRGELTEVEGCLSIPNKWGTVRRPRWAKVRAQDRNGKVFELEGEGGIARAFSHEIDHLDGILFIDKVIEYVDITKETDQKAD